MDRLALISQLNDVCLYQLAQLTEEYQLRDGKTIRAA